MQDANFFGKKNKACYSCRMQSSDKSKMTGVSPAKGTGGTCTPKKQYLKNLFPAEYYHT